MARFRKVRDLTGTAHTGQWGIGGTDLGAMVRMPSGELLAVFGDTFEQDTVGGPGWRSPVGLIGHLDEQGVLQWDQAAGPNPSYAEKWWHYDQGGEVFSTVLPSDVVVVGDAIYLHVMVNKGLGNVLWTEVWRSTDNARSFQHLYKIDGWEDSDEAQLWGWDYDPSDGYVYAMTTKFDRQRGLRLRRIPADRMHDKTAWEKWGWHGDRWAWGEHTTPILGGKFGEFTLRRLGDEQWVLAMFDAGAYRIDVRTLSHPTANMYSAPVHTVLTGGSWGMENHQDGVVAQLYGAYVVPGSELGVVDGFQLVVSQWNTDTGWPYRSMLFRGTVPGLPTAGEQQPAEEPVDPCAGLSFFARLRCLMGL